MLRTLQLTKATRVHVRARQAVAHAKHFSNMRQPTLANAMLWLLLRVARAAPYLVTTPQDPIIWTIEVNKAYHCDLGTGLLKFDTPKLAYWEPVNQPPDFVINPDFHVSHGLGFPGAQWAKAAQLYVPCNYTTEGDIQARTYTCPDMAYINWIDYYTKYVQEFACYVVP